MSKNNLIKYISLEIFFKLYVVPLSSINPIIEYTTQIVDISIFRSIICFTYL